MEEIEVGEYVRLDDGIIGKYTTNKNYWNVVKTNNKEIGFDIENDVVKHSKNIIDLIEEGDYVNGEYVLNIDTNIGNYGEKTIITELNNRYFGSQIISVLTKEQFNSIAYRLEE